MSTDYPRKESITEDPGEGLLLLRQPYLWETLREAYQGLVFMLQVLKNLKNWG